MCILELGVMVDLRGGSKQPITGNASNLVIFAWVRRSRSRSSEGMIVHHRSHLKSMPIFFVRGGAGDFSRKPSQNVTTKSSSHFGQKNDPELGDPFG